MIVALTEALWHAVAAFVVVSAACPPDAEPGAPVGTVRPGGVVRPGDTVPPAGAILPDGNVDRIEAGLAVILTDAGPIIHREACDLREGDVIRNGLPDPVARDALERVVRHRRGRLSAGDDGRDLDL